MALRTWIQLAAACALLIGAPQDFFIGSDGSLRVVGTASAAPNPSNDPRAAINAALELLSAARPQEALDQLTRLLNAERTRSGENTPTYVLALALRGTALTKLSRFNEAEVVLKNALDGMQRVLGPDQPMLAVILQDLVTIYGITGRCAEGEVAAARALAQFERTLGPASAQAGQALHGLALLNTRCGRYEQAEQFAKRALANRETQNPREDSLIADSFQSLGSIYRDSGRLAEAEPYLKRALAMHEQVFGREHQSVATGLDQLAQLYMQLRRFSEALPLFQRSLAISEKLYGRDVAVVAAALNNLAQCLAFGGAPAEAEPLYRRALTITERLSGADSVPAAEILERMTLNYNKLGRLADAEQAGERALRIQERVRGVDDPKLTGSLLSLGVHYHETGRYEKAENFYGRALALLQKSGRVRTPEFITALRNLTEVHLAQGRTREALDASRGGVRTVVARLSTEAARVNDLRTFDMALDVLDRAVGEKLVGREAGLEMFEAAQWANQTAAAAAIGQLEARFAVGGDALGRLVREQQDAADEFRQIDATLISELSKPADRRDRGREEATRRKLAELERKLQQLTARLAAEFPDFAALARPKPLSVTDLQALLAPEEALVLLYPSRSGGTLIVAVTRQDFGWHTAALGGTALGDKVAAFRRGLDTDMVLDQATLDEMGKKRELFDLDGAHALYGALLRPVEGLIKDKRHLLVVPAGPLTALPFHLLVTEPSAGGDPTGYRQAAWLVRRHAVTVLPSAASLRALRAFAGKERGARAMIGFGDPIFKAEPPAAAGKRVVRNVSAAPAYSDFWRGAGVDRTKLSEALSPLPDTADELKAIAGKLGAPESDIFLGRAATETAVKRAPLVDYRIVYFATHGLVAGDIKDVAEPSLALSLPLQPSAVDDGLLTASEVAQLKLNADWVVLSACNTIAGGAAGAEALSGLARAFFYAGARALLVSHWAVDSAAATRLTTTAFGILQADPSVGRAEALRRAMLDYLNDQSDLKNAYPAMWGAFSIIGEGAAR